MTSPRKPGFVLPVAVTLALLLGLYVGAYYWLIEPKKVDGHERLINSVVSREISFVASYRRGGVFSERFFGPAHLLDCTVFDVLIAASVVFQAPCTAACTLAAPWRAFASLSANDS